MYKPSTKSGAVRLQVNLTELDDIARASRSSNILVLNIARAVSNSDCGTAREFANVLARDETGLAGDNP